MLFTDSGWVTDWLVKAGLGAVAGAFIVNEINRRIAAASEQRRYLGRALSDLLAMHFELTAARHARRNMESIATEKNIPFSDFVSGLGLYLIERMRKIRNLAQGNRFEEAITAVAGIRPVLADDLRRAQDLVQVPGSVWQMLDAFSSQRVGDGAAAESPDQQKTGAVVEKEVETEASALLYHWSHFEELALEALQSSIFDLAMKHGWRTLFQTTRVLRQRNSMKPRPETAELVKALLDKLETLPREKIEV